MKILVLIAVVLNILLCASVVYAPAKGTCYIENSDCTGSYAGSLTCEKCKQMGGKSWLRASGIQNCVTSCKSCNKYCTEVQQEGLCIHSPYSGGKCKFPPAMCNDEFKEEDIWGPDVIVIGITDCYSNQICACRQCADQCKDKQGTTTGSAVFDAESVIRKIQPRLSGNAIASITGRAPGCVDPVSGALCAESSPGAGYVNIGPCSEGDPLYDCPENGGGAAILDVTGAQGAEEYYCYCEFDMVVPEYYTTPLRALVAVIFVSLIILIVWRKGFD